jgi:beta-galactosidase
MVLYRRRVRGGGMLKLDGVRDYALVFKNGRFVGSVSRVEHPSLHSNPAITLPGDAAETETLEILVDSFGHVGYGHAMIDRKGLVGDVRLDGEPLRDWEVFSLPLDDAWLGKLKPSQDTPTRPGVFFRAALQFARPGDCYLDMSGWNKGYLWVNGRLLGRYWHTGPQQRLFCPGVWLSEGGNDVLVLDLHRTEPVSIASALTLAAAH